MDEIIHATPTSLFRRNLSRLLVLASLLVTSALLSNLVILFNQPSLSGLFSALFTYTLFYSVPAALLLTTLAQAVSLRLSAASATCCLADCGWVICTWPASPAIQSW
ncbi:hypothetical protein ACFQMB_17570 [Pseudobowmanella zhangzhouensis]|uniref:hypothetical protein n=1 Tax=Pseudobowmanella zhangzhouensis TaxID=1537679 RepID=UPI00361438C2